MRFGVRHGFTFVHEIQEVFGGSDTLMQRAQ